MVLLPRLYLLISYVKVLSKRYSTCHVTSSIGNMEPKWSTWKCDLIRGSHSACCQTQYCIIARIAVSFM